MIQRTPNETIFICDWCGRELRRKRSEFPPPWIEGKFCSPKCQKEWEDNRNHSNRR